MYEIYCNDETFPDSLKSITPKIKRIFACGDISLLKETSIAVIGSRNCSDYGKKITKEITKILTDNNIVIVSGMALGIDSVAHESCIDNGGKTIAVLGSGFKHIYPKENTKLFHKIIDSGGLVISEYPLDEQVQMKNFPKRNRIISGLSNGVLVVEAAYRSGTSITARYAKKQGKKVFCVPNSIGNKNSYGSIELAKNGAIIITDGDEILENLKIKHKKIAKNNNYKNNDNVIKKLDDNSRAIYECLISEQFLDCDQISIKTGIDVIKVNQTLSFMELDGIIENTKINKYKLCDKFLE